MKLKLDDQGHVVVQDGKPVYVHDDGKEVAFDAAGTVATITRLNGEAKGHREGRQAAETALKAFEGIADPAAALKALSLTANLDAKKLIDAGEVETLKASITKNYEEKLTATEKRAADLEANLYSATIGNAFAQSKFISEKAAVPSDMIRSHFGSAFKLESGVISAYDASGNRIYSRAKPGEAATFDEALEILVDNYAYKDNILKGNSNSGGGTRQGGATGGKTITREAFGKMDPVAQKNAVTTGGMTVVD